MVGIKHKKTNSVTAWTQADIDAQIAAGNIPAGTLLSGFVVSTDWNDEHSSGAASSGQVLTADGAGGAAFTTPTGGGNVTGPASSTDNAITRYDGATGHLIQNSNVLLDDSGNIIVAPNTNIISSNLLAAFPTNRLPQIWLSCNDVNGTGLNSPACSMTLTNTSTVNKFGELAFNKWPGSSGTPTDTWALAVDPALANVENLKLRHTGADSLEWLADNSAMIAYTNVVLDGSIGKILQSYNAARSSLINMARIATYNTVVDTLILGMSGSTLAGTTIQSGAGGVTVENLAGTGTRVVTATSTGLLAATTAVGSFITGSGTSGQLAKWTGTNTEGNSIVADDGSYVTIGSTGGTSRLTVYDPVGSTQSFQEIRFGKNTGTDYVIRRNTGTGNCEFIGSQAGAMGYRWLNTTAQIAFIAEDGTTTLNKYAGTGTRLMTASSTGVLGTQVTGDLTDAGTDGITVTGGTGAVIGTGTSLSQHVADATHNGYLSSTDWSTFNGKQGAITLTTTGTSGAATFVANTLNIPQYSGGGGTPGGSTTQVQYNNAGAFGGITGATTNGTALTLVAPILGTPASGTLISCTGLPVSTGISGLATGVATFLATPSSANLLAAITDETGTGKAVFATSPTLITPLLGTPTSGILTNCTGLPIGSGVSGLGTGVATFLATPSSANLISAVTDETGTGALVFANTPTLVTPAIGAATGTSLTLSGLTASSPVYTNASKQLVSGSPFAQIALTAQSAALTASTIVAAVPATGMYLVSWVASVTRAATTSCVLGGGTGFVLFYTDGDTSAVKTFSPASSSNMTSTGNNTITCVYGTAVAYALTGTSLSFSFGYTSLGATTMQYNMHIAVTPL